MDLAGLLEVFEAIFAPASDNSALGGFDDLSMFPSAIRGALPLVQLGHTYKTAPTLRCSMLFGVVLERVEGCWCRLPVRPPDAITATLEHDPEIRPST